MLLKTILTNCYNQFGFPEPTFYRRNGKTFITIYPFSLPISLSWPMDRFHEIANIDRFDENLSEEEKIFYLTCLFEENLGYTPDFQNPQTFNEKIQWLKLHCRNPLLTKCADKYRVREYVSQKIGDEYLVPLIGVYDSDDEIDFNALPEQFVIKVNWGSGQNIICRDQKCLDKKKVKKQLKKWLEPKSNHYYSSFEWCYKDIVPKITVEQYIENSFSNLEDYKVFCFGGKAYYIMYLTDRNTDGLKMSFYDTQWQKQDFVYTYPMCEKEIHKPDHLDKMLQLAEVLSKPFPHARIDFYQLNNGDIKFGEITFNSFGGFCKWEPQNVDLELGNLIDLHKD